ncbi:MAG: TonB family protein [Nitrospirae bacterium]|nr:TonB family protein [Nitrospirota bacterium]
MSYKASNITGITVSIIIHLLIFIIPISVVKTTVKDRSGVQINFYSIMPVQEKNTFTPSVKEIRKRKIQKRAVKLPSKKRERVPAVENKTVKTKHPEPLVHQTINRKEEAIHISEEKIPRTISEQVTKDITPDVSDTGQNSMKEDVNVISTEYPPKGDDKPSQRPAEDTIKNEPYQGPFGVGDGPRFSRTVMPEYPRFARRRGIEGKVVLKLRIDEKGSLKGVEVIEPGGFGFTDAALRAVRQSSFIPAHRNGRPVPAEAILTVKFRLK